MQRNNSLSRYAASNPASVLQIDCLELWHPSWPLPVRLVRQPSNWTVMVDGVPTLFNGWSGSAGPWQSEFPNTDDAGRATRQIVVDDADGVIARLIDETDDTAEAIAVVIRYYSSADLTTPQIVETYSVQSAEPDDDQLTITASTADIANYSDPSIRHTLMNSPGLRGR